MRASCPVCGETVGCGCVREVGTPRHPYDYEHFRRGMVEDFGEFKGLSNKLTDKGVHTVQGVRLRMARALDGSVMREMGSWVVKQSLRGRSSAWESVLFKKYGEEGAEEEGEGEKDVVTELMEIRGGLCGSPVSGVEHTVLESQDGFELLSGTEQGTGLEWWERRDANEESEPVESARTDVREDLEKAMRKKLMNELRKQRNRESAKRSNAKNKKKKEEMQEELEYLYNREEELRELETRLRRENLSLKDQARRSAVL